MGRVRAGVAEEHHGKDSEVQTASRENGKVRERKPTEPGTESLFLKSEQFQEDILPVFLHQSPSWKGKYNPDLKNRGLARRTY